MVSAQMKVFNVLQVVNKVTKSSNINTLGVSKTDK